MSQESKFLKNPQTGKWVILASHRAGRPHDRKIVTSLCPFCPGNEKETPSEVYRLGSGDKNSPGWEIRIFPNLYPFAPIHEIIVHSPAHKDNFFTYDPLYIKKIFSVFCQRFNEYKSTGQVVIFHNFGKEAGESRVHNHSQLAVVPKNVQIEVESVGDVENLIHSGEVLDVFIPQASAWPYEVWFLPKKRNRFFDEMSERENEELSYFFSKILKRLEKFLGKRFSFNFYINPKKDWYLRLIPRTKVPAGFELATQIYVNTKSPYEAARELSW